MQNPYVHYAGDGLGPRDVFVNGNPIQWTSSDPTIASVVTTGQKTATVTRNAAGTAIITGKARTYTATSEITVTAP